MDNDLFGEPVKSTENKTVWNKKALSLYGNMIAIHGTKEKEKCKNCIFCHRFQYSASFYKCEKADPGCKSGPAGDWRANWPACGLFEAEEVKP